MRFSRLIVIPFLLALLPISARAGDNPVVIELFTSQGCSSCPPADLLLQELAKRPEVIALALHVDYWDYIGWKDTLGSAENTARQQGYARAAHARTIYTPQFMIAGQIALGGAHSAEIEGEIAKSRGASDPVRISVERNGDGQIKIAAEPLVRLAGPVLIELVRFAPEVTVDITRGENKGRRISYANVVTSWQTLGTWSGRGALTVEAPYLGDEPGVIILQDANHGPIYAAARIN